MLNGPIARVSLLLVAVLALRAEAKGPAGPPDRPVKINVLSVYKIGEASFGACDQVSIWYDKTADQRTRIAFIEDEIDGLGEIWRAATWQAAVVAADLSGQDLAGVRIFQERSGRVDGPSAGAITTIGILAALRGDSVQPDVAMTGSINPDGTVGPVGGIRFKIAGAAAAGMKTVLVPYGSRTEHDAKSNKDIDLVQHGADLGVKVHLVGDVYTAYQLATGVRLPRPQPALNPSLENRMYQGVRQCIDEWRVRYDEQLDKYREVPELFRGEYTDDLIEKATEQMASLDRLLAQGQAPTAFNEAFEAAFNVALASETGRAEWVDESRGRDEMRVYVKRFSHSGSKIKNTVQRLKNFRPKNLAQLGTQIYAYATLIEAICQHQIGEAIVSGEVVLPLFNDELTADEEEVERLLEAVEFYLSASFNCAIVEDIVQMAGELQGPALPDNLPIHATAEFLRRAAQANLNQFEKAVIDSRAEGRRIAFADARDEVLFEDLDYLTTWWASRRSPLQVLSNFDASEFDNARLGMAINGYSHSSILMAKYYSLGMVLDEEETLVGVRREAALEFMLDFSEDQASRNIGLLQRNGVDASDVIFNKMVASSFASRDTDSRLYALQVLWEGNVVARTLAYLGGFADLESAQNGVAP